jgi:hypothetical protein
MVTYIAHLTVRHEIHDEFVTWLKSEHIPDVLKVAGFLSAELCLRKGGAMEASSKDVKVIYSVESEAHIKAYMTEYALPLREKGIQKFPGMFSAQREVWLETVKFLAK